MSRLSLRQAVDAKCKDCIYDPGSGNGGWREQVAGCSSSNCPLHCVRPLPVKAKNPAAERKKDFAAVLVASTEPQGNSGEKYDHHDDAFGRRRAA